MRYGLYVLLLVVPFGCSQTPEEQYHTGLKYAYGEDVPRDTVEAAKWYRKAAVRGHAEAQHKLGCAYHLGEGVARDQAEAVKWVRMAAEQGYALSQYTLGVEYADGTGAFESHVEAYVWLRLFLDNPALKPDELIAFSRERIAALDESMTEQQLSDAQDQLRQLQKKIRRASRKQ